MTSGSVVVTGCELGEGRRISAGEQLRMTCRYHDGQGTLTALEPGPAARLAASPGASEATPATAVTAEQRASSTATMTSPTPPLFGIPEMPTIVPVASGSAATAVGAPRVAVAPSSEPSVDGATAAELLALGERARYAGNERAAVDAFTALRTRFPNTELAAAAAFELGRLAADNRHDFSGAAVLFDACARERPTGNLAREAMGRALEAREHGGATAHSAAVATDYLRLYPMGPHAALARRVLSGGGDAGPLPERADTGAP